VTATSIRNTKEQRGEVQRSKAKKGERRKKSTSPHLLSQLDPTLCRARINCLVEHMMLLLAAPQQQQLMQAAVVQQQQQQQQHMELTRALLQHL
jgi:hypothetical protein